MRFFQKIAAVFTGIKAMRNAGDNFRFIAQNIATIYYIIDNSKFGITLNDEQKLYATALIDTYVDISKGKISIEDVAEGVSYGLHGIVFVPPYSKQNDIFDIRDNRQLLYVSMQIEAMIFSIDTNVHAYQIIDQIFAHKEDIYNMIYETLEQGKSSPLYKGMLPKVTAMIEELEFQDIVLSDDRFKDD